MSQRHARYGLLGRVSSMRARRERSMSLAGFDDATIHVAPSMNLLSGYSRIAKRPPRSGGLDKIGADRSRSVSVKAGTCPVLRPDCRQRGASSDTAVSNSPVKNCASDRGRRTNPRRHSSPSKRRRRTARCRILFSSCHRTAAGRRLVSISAIAVAWSREPASCAPSV